MSFARRSFDHKTSRRAFVVASSLGFAGLNFGAPAVARAAQESAPPGGGRAKSTILFFLSGGASHIDTWDMKPKAPAEYRGPFQPIATSAPGVTLCEHLPMLAKQAHHLAVINSICSTVNTNDHHGGYYYNLTGHEPDRTFLTLGNDRRPMADDWPYMGSVVAAKRPKHPRLPNAITLPEMPSQLPYTRPGQFAARLGLEHDPLYVLGSNEKPLVFQSPALALGGGLTTERLQNRLELYRALDSTRRDMDHVSRVENWSKQKERAVSLLTSAQTIDAFNVASEPLAVRERYGHTINGTSLLLARRLVEVGVPFVTVFWMGNDKVGKICKSGGGWDTHGSNFHCLKELLLPEFDRGFSALIEDLSTRGMLDETLLLVTSEMGRKPKIGDPRSGGVKGAGRDHWTHCLTDVMAGGGLRGGQHYGTSDRYAEFPAEKPITPAHVTRTVYHAMGITDLQATDPQGRPYDLLADGAPLHELF